MRDSDIFIELVPREGIHGEDGSGAAISELEVDGLVVHATAVGSGL
jgi:hypothetical protein